MYKFETNETLLKRLGIPLLPGLFSATIEAEVGNLPYVVLKLYLEKYEVEQIDFLTLMNSGISHSTLMGLINTGQVI